MFQLNSQPRYQPLRQLRPHAVLIRMCLLFILSLVGTLPALAGVGEVRAILAKRSAASHQPFNPSDVKETLIKGLYRWEGARGTAPAYVNEAVTLILNTNNQTIVSWDQPVRNPEPISDAEKNAMLLEMLKSIRFDQLIHFRQGNGGNQLLVLSAWDCPYCQKFERMLAQGGNKLDVDMVVLPTTLRSDENSALSTVRNIWCASDSARAWRNSLVKGQGYFDLPARSCDLSNIMTHDVEIILKSLGQRIGYPLVIFSNGAIGTPSYDVPGFIADLKNTAGNAFWTPGQTDKYAQFRASGAANGGNGIVTTKKIKIDIGSLFRREASASSSAEASAPAAAAPAAYNGPSIGLSPMLETRVAAPSVANNTNVTNAANGTATAVADAGNAKLNPKLVAQLHCQNLNFSDDALPRLLAQMAQTTPDKVWENDLAVPSGYNFNGLPIERVKLSETDGGWLAMLLTGDQAAVAAAIKKSNVKGNTSLAWLRRADGPGMPFDGKGAGQIYVQCQSKKRS